MDKSKRITIQANVIFYIAWFIVALVIGKIFSPIVFVVFIIMGVTFVPTSEIRRVSVKRIEKKLVKFYND